MRDIVVVEGHGFVDEVAIANNPQRLGFQILVRREYDRIRERLDIKGNVDWVRWQRVKNGLTP